MILRPLFSGFIAEMFLVHKKRNLLLAAGMIGFNTLAACLEGLSFIFILASFAILTGEKLPSHRFVTALQFFDPFSFFLLTAITLQILRSAASYFSQILTTALTINIQDEAQKQIFKKIFRMAYGEISALKRGDLLHQSSSPPSFVPFLLDEFNRLVTALLMMGAYLLLMFRISPFLTLVVGVFFALAAFLQRKFFATITHASHHHAEHIATLSKETSQNLEGMKLIHLFHKQEQTYLKIEEVLKKIASATKKIKKWNALIPALNDSLGVILVGISLLAGICLFRLRGEPFAASLFIYLTLTYRMAMRLQHCMIAKGMIAYYSGPITKIGEILSIAEGRTPTGKLALPTFKTAITLENVSFSYPKQEQYALKQVTLTLPKNQIIAVVGKSGAGKSSLIDILAGLYTPTEGAIYMDDRSMNDYSLDSWRSLFGIVTQDSFLFHGTVAENIGFGTYGATEADIQGAASLAGADTFIKKLPQGYQTVIGERGWRLSGGEKQRISLAQALIRNPEILILDEATSHLDSQSEQIIQEMIQRLRGEKTFLIVAHRLATVQMADIIYVLEEGRVIERGSHYQLLRLEGRYHSLWMLQQPLTDLRAAETTVESQARTAYTADLATFG